MWIMKGEINEHIRTTSRIKTMLLKPNKVVLFSRAYMISQVMISSNHYEWKNAINHQQGTTINGRCQTKFDHER